MARSLRTPEHPGPQGVDPFPFQSLTIQPMSKKFKAPAFLDGIHDQAAYHRWLHRKAMAHVRRDRKRGNDAVTVSLYKLAIHAAVVESEGKDYYTGEKLDWSLLSQYNNVESKAHRREYKRRFQLLPSVDHVGDGLGPPDFKICSWRTNDCKNDLSHQELIEFCKRVIRHSQKRASGSPRRRQTRNEG